MVRRRLALLALAGAGIAAIAWANSSATAVTLPSPPRDVVRLALREPCLDFAREAPQPTDAPDHAPDPVSSVDYGAGASLVLAAAAGKDPRARQATLQQIRHLIDRRHRCRREAFRGGSSEPTAAGGVSAQRELWATSMFVVAKHTPSLWRGLSVYERKRIDLIMLGSLVANAFVSSDANPFLPPGQQRTIDGDTNVGRDWNPNYREGIVGNVLMGIAYFGRTGAARRLQAWDRSAFLQAVTERRMDNLRTTFSWASEHPASGAPDDASVKAAISTWAYHGIGLDRPMELYAALTTYTFALPVDCGLGAGQGLADHTGTTGGRLADPASCAKVPAAGKPGMVRELASQDNGGPRSSVIYAYLGARSNLATQVALLAAKLWKPGPIGDGAVTTTDLTRLRQVGMSDLFTKLHLGYISYANGATTLPPGHQPGHYTLSLSAPGRYGRAFVYTQSLWTDVTLRSSRYAGPAGVGP